MSIENVGRYSNVSSISSNAFSARSLSDEFGLFGAIGGFYLFGKCEDNA